MNTKTTGSLASSPAPSTAEHGYEQHIAEGHANRSARTRSRVPRCPLRGRYADAATPSTATGCVLSEMFPEWMDLKTAQTYVCVSERTLREWIHRDHDPLPAFQDGGKIFINRTRLDRWMLSHPVTSSLTDVDLIVNAVVSSMTGKQ